MHIYAYSFVHVVVSRKKSTNFSLGKVYIAIYIILTYTYISASMNACYFKLYINTYVHIRTCLCMHVCECVCMCVCLCCVCRCVAIYVYVCACEYIRMLWSHQD